jgi:hypothetical protein
LYLFCRGESGGAIALRMRYAPDSPRLSLVAILMAFQIYVGLSFLGGPDRSGQIATAIPSLDPSLQWRLGYWECYRTWLQNTAAVVLLLLPSFSTFGASTLVTLAIVFPYSPLVKKWLRFMVKVSKTIEGSKSHFGLKLLTLNAI